MTGQEIKRLAAHYHRHAVSGAARYANDVEAWAAGKITLVVAMFELSEHLNLAAHSALPDTPAFKLARERATSGIETEGHDPAEGRGAKHESPTAESGDVPKDIA